MLDIYAREIWDAADPLAEVPASHPLKHIFWMATRRYPCVSKRTCCKIIKDIQSFHMLRQKQRDIRYNFLIGGDGKIYECRGWWVTAMLPYRYSSLQNTSFIIGFVGEYTVNTLPEPLMSAAHELIQHGVKMGYLAPTYKNHDIMEKSYTDDDTNKPRS